MIIVSTEKGDSFTFPSGSFAASSKPPTHHFNFISDDDCYSQSYPHSQYTIIVPWVAVLPPSPSEPPLAMLPLLLLFSSIFLLAGVVIIILHSTPLTRSDGLRSQPSSQSQSVAAGGKDFNVVTDKFTKWLTVIEPFLKEKGEDWPKLELKNPPPLLWW